MLQVICGFVVGLLLAGLGFGLVGGGVPGLIVAVVLAALGYIAASTLTEPERRIGKMLVSASTRRTLNSTRSPCSPSKYVTQPSKPKPTTSSPLPKIECNT